MGLKIVTNTLSTGLNKYFRIVGINSGRASKGGAHYKAMRAGGVQLLNWILNGSASESRVPPIMTGFLRGSGSVFVENDCVLTSRGNYGIGDPSYDHDAGKDAIAVGFNTAYAAKMHEGTWVPGGARPSKQAQRNPGMTGDVGNKFVERHLIADGKAFLELYAMTLKKESGA